jgi:hypothetical protein
MHTSCERDYKNGGSCRKRHRDEGKIILAQEGSRGVGDKLIEIAKHNDTAAKAAYSLNLKDPVEKVYDLLKNIN